MSTDSQLRGCIFSSNLGFLVVVKQQLLHQPCHYQIHSLAFLCLCSVYFFIFIKLPQIYLPLK